MVHEMYYPYSSGPLFTKRTGVLLHLAKSRGREIQIQTFYRSKIWQASRQQRCRDACEISEGYDHYNIQFRGFKASWDLTVGRLSILGKIKNSHICREADVIQF